MPVPRLALYLSLACAATWGAKAIAIWTAGGLSKSPLESPLFVLGLVLALAALATTGVALAAGRSIPWRILGGLVGLFVAVCLALASDALADIVVPDSAGWVQEEAGLWFSALVIVAIAFAVHRARANTP